MRIRFNKMALALMGGGLIVGLAGCGGGSGGGAGVSVTTPPVNVSAQATGLNLVFIDGITGQPVSTEVRSTLTGQTAGKLTTLPNINGSVTPLNSPSIVTSTSATLSLLADFSAGLSFTVTPDPTSWIADPVVITQAHAGKTVRIKVLPKSFTSAAYSVNSVTASQTQNSTASVGDTRIEVTATAATNLNIATISVVTASNTSSLLAALPGSTFGLGMGAVDGMARFIATGSNGQPVTDFSNHPVTLQIPLPASSNQADGSTYTGGIYSFDETSQTWKVETGITGIVRVLGSAPNQRRVVEFTSPHLTTWFLGATGNSCIYNPVQLTGRPAGNTEELTVQLATAPGGTTYPSLTLSPVTDNQLDLFFAPNYDVSVTITKGASQLYSGVVNVCTPGLQLPLSNFTPASPATLRVNVTEHCKLDINAYSQPGPTTVLFLPANSAIASGGWTGEDGSIDITKAYNSSGIEGNLLLGASGRLKIWNRFSSSWFEIPDFVVDQSLETVNMQFNELNCDIPTGTTGATGAY